MIHSSRFTAILDANVLYPAPLRDFLLTLADVNLYRPKWSQTIQGEWVRNLLLKRPDLNHKSLQRTCDAMNAAFPDATVTNYSEIMSGLILPDFDDRHVLAAAIKCNADVIVTFNLKDFPVNYLKAYDIEPQHPDDFIMNIIHLDEATALQALTNQIKRLKNPSKSTIEVLDTLENGGLVKSDEIFRRLI